MNILILGSGGREHALGWALARSPSADRLFFMPGNAGMATLGTCVSGDPCDAQAVLSLCAVQGIEFVVVGPEAPLVAGVADALADAGLLVFGPSAEAAQLEASKAFTKSLCRDHAIPTAEYATFETAEAAIEHIRARPAPYVVKADGLAAGKGVIIAQTEADAIAAVRTMFDGAFGAAGARVVIEAFMVGEEASFFALCDGETVLPLATAQDHKRVGEGDTGPNTGGMGAYSPAPVMTEARIEETLERIIRPTVRALHDRGTPYRGVLYAGLMITDEGIKLVEYNARFGDPEAQVLMMRLKSDLLPALLAVARGRLVGHSLEWHADPAMTVVMASQGYPGAYDKGSVIGGLSAINQDTDLAIFHAGTRERGGQIEAAGGRVLNVTAMAPTLAAARERAYLAIDRIDWPEGFCRRDIGWRALDHDPA